MTDIQNLTAQQLRRAADLQEKIEKLNGELQSILGDGGGNGVPSPFVRKGRPPGGGKVKAAGTGRRKMSAAGRARIAAAAKLRWKKAKEADRNSL